VNLPEKLIFVRHYKAHKAGSKPVAKYKETRLSDSQFPLRQEGIAQAKVVRSWLDVVFPEIDGYLCPEYVRSSQSAGLTFPDISWSVDPNLDERSHGTGFVSFFRQALKSSIFLYHTRSVESMVDVVDRWQKVKARLAAEYADSKCVLAFSHGEYIAGVQCDLERISRAWYDQHYKELILPHGGILVYSRYSHGDSGDLQPEYVKKRVVDLFGRKDTGWLDISGVTPGPATAVAGSTLVDRAWQFSIFEE
jgi:broad specificity phosphatase PhoE